MIDLKLGAWALHHLVLFKIHMLSNNEALKFNLHGHGSRITTKTPIYQKLGDNNLVSILADSTLGNDTRIDA